MYDIKKTRLVHPSDFEGNFLKAILEKIHINTEKRYIRKVEYFTINC